jgi:hypothetical protein
VTTAQLPCGHRCKAGGKDREQRRRPVDPPHRLIRLLQTELQPVELHRWNWGQGRRDKPANRLAFEYFGNLSAEAGFGRQLGHQNLLLQFSVTKGWRYFL